MKNRKYPEKTQRPEEAPKALEHNSNKSKQDKVISEQNLKNKNMWKTSSLIKLVIVAVPLLIVIAVIFTLIEPRLLTHKITAPTQHVDITATVISDEDFLKTVTFGSVNNVQNMLEVGANPKAVDENGRNAMALAAMFRSAPGMIEALHRFGVDINHKDNQGYTPIMLAIIAGTPQDIINELITKGADVNMQTNEGNSVLMVALSISPNNVSLIKSLLKAGAKVNYNSPHGVTPLMIALRTCSSPVVVHKLLKLGANPAAKDDLGFTTLDVLKTNPILLKDSYLRSVISKANSD